MASILWFFLSMSVYPEVERKAQEELDRVVGQDRLPTYSDRDNLPYIDAVLKEILRWQPVAPMAIPHFATEDDVYMGYSIPKGTMLMPNSWHFMHDPAVYKDPSVFNPERHLGPTPEPDPRIYAFGFGRRVCPGRNLAENSLYLAVVQTLATFHISKAVDDNGNVIEPTIKMLPGIVSHPAPFKVAVKPRSEHHERLVRSLEETYPWVKSDADAIKEMGV